MYKKLKEDIKNLNEQIENLQNQLNESIKKNDAEIYLIKYPHGKIESLVLPWSGAETDYKYSNGKEIYKIKLANAYFNIAYYKIFEKDENVYIAIKIINDNNDKTNETEYYFVVNKCNQNVINYKNQDILNNLNLKWKKFSNK